MSDPVELDVQRERAAKNQSLFREVNERIEELSASTSPTRFIGECANERCEEKVSLTRGTMSGFARTRTVSSWSTAMSCPGSSR
jgi:hypothetical protein